jgi:hypothetical protein
MGISFRDSASERVGEGSMIVTSEKYPNILEAIHCMQDEMRATGSLRIPVQEVPDRWARYLDEIDETIGKLSRKERAPEAEPLPAHVKPSELLDSEFYSFCNGDGDPMRAMGNRDLQHARAGLFLDDFFEDWQLTGDEPKSSPENVALQRRLEWLEAVKNESAMGLQGSQLEEYERVRMEIV